MEEKIEKILEILKDLTLAQWHQIKNEIDIAYRDVELKKVPNSELRNLKQNLICKLLPWNKIRLYLDK